MKSRKRYFIMGILALFLLALPITAFAGQKKLYKAYLTQDSVVNSAQTVAPTGVGILSIAEGGVSPGGLRFQVGARELSSSETARLESTGGGGSDISVHIHGAAPAGQNGPIVVTLCGEPAPSVLGSCDVTKEGTLKIMGSIEKQYIVGMTAAEFFDALNNDELYIQVHADGTPIIRGQLYEQ